MDLSFERQGQQRDLSLNAYLVQMLFARLTALLVLWRSALYSPVKSENTYLRGILPANAFSHSLIVDAYAAKHFDV